ncbi:hypothetical protein ABPG72_022268 [Tetrahymena utriculariae]
MLLKETEELFSQLLLNIADEEKNMEVARQILCEQIEFEPQTALKRLDRRKNGTINAANIQEFLTNNGLFYSEEQCHGLVRRYDQNNDDRLCLEDFKRCVLPQENLALKALVCQRKQYEVQQIEMLTYDVEFALARVFQREIIAYKQFEEFKKLIQQRVDFNHFNSLFSLVDVYNCGCINIENLMDFFKKKGYQMPERDIVAILRYLDKNDDGVVDYKEFEFFMQQTLNSRVRKNKYGNNFDGEGEKLEEYRNKKATPQLFYVLNSNGQVKDKKTDDIHFNFIAASQRTNQSINKHIVNTQKIAKFKEDKEMQIYNKKSPFQQNLHGQRLSLNPNSRSSKSLKLLEEQGELARTLKQIINLEKEVEQAKESLVSRNDFNLLDAFRLFDVDGKGRIQCNEFMTLFESLDLYPGRHELYLVIRRYDNDGDGHIRFADFADMMTPIRQEYSALGKLNAHSRVQNNIQVMQEYIKDQSLKEAAIQKPPLYKQTRIAQTHQNDIFYQESSLFSCETRVALIRLLSLMLENEAACECLRQRLHLRKSFDLKHIFHSLQQDNIQNQVQSNKLGLLGPQDFKILLENHGIIIEYTDLIYLFSRFDKNKDQFVSLAEFIQELSPKSPQQYY